MTKDQKTYHDIMSGNHDRNIMFSDIKHLLLSMNFRCSIKGDHFIFRKDDTPIINLQPDNGKAKGYQVRQIRKIFREKELEV